MAESIEQKPPETIAAKENKATKEETIRILWVGLFLINVILTIGAIVLCVSASKWQRELNSREISNTTTETILEDRVVNLREITNLVAQIEAAEENAKFYLSIFESISFWVSMIGIMVVVLGVVAAVVGASNLTEMTTKLETSRKELEEQKNDLSQKVTAEISQLRGIDTQTQARLEEFNQARKLTSQLEDEFRKNRQAFTLVSLAERDLRSRNIKSAVSTLKHALELDKDNPLAHYYLGVSLTSLEELEESRQHLEAALAVDENFHHARAALGYTIRRIGEQKEGKEQDKDFNKAEELMSLALAQDKALVDFEGESWNGALGGLYRRQNRLDDAKYYYESAAKVTPGSSYPVSNLARIALERLSDDIALLYTQVERLAQREVNLDFGNYWAYSDLLAAQLILGRETVQDTLRDLLLAIPQEVTDVLPRVIEAIKAVKNAPKFTDDARDFAMIDEVLAQLKAVANIPD